MTAIGEQGGKEKNSAWQDKRFLSCLATHVTGSLDSILGDITGWRAAFLKEKGRRA